MSAAGDNKRLVDAGMLSRFARNPAVGPRLLFFSGGTALRDIARNISVLTENSIHVITTFDSGGSSAMLRRVFGLPAVGDLRNRLMALADQTRFGNPEVVQLFAWRFPKDKSQDELVQIFTDMTRGNHPLVAAVPDGLGKVIRGYLFRFLDNMPPDFSLQGACVGNLVIASGCLYGDETLEEVIATFSRLVRANGLVLPVTEQSCHLTATLEDGEVLCGQHLLTGKETAPITSPVTSLHLSELLSGPEKVHADVSPSVLRCIQWADILCYPMGSFFTSLIATLLPAGVGMEISRSSSPKVYVPSTGCDPETIGMTVADQVEYLLRTLCADAPDELTHADVLDFVLLDEHDGFYFNGVEENRIRKMGVDVRRVPLVSKPYAPYIDPDRLLPVLLSLS
ncbi:MAG: GAK system CofD-like protein [Desulfovibrio sp.]